ncbi:MAG: hypothetical protein PHE87_00745 [Victivallaceae bacterium]|nr:hypothetical protein [Victivallaceae bacterium]
MIRFLKLFSLVLAMAFALSSCTVVEEPNKSTRTLARHETVAEFQGTKYHRCLGMTSLCPDKCGASGTIAVFKIINYLDYNKFGEYGDPKSEQFVFLIEDNMKNLKVPVNIRDTVNSLKEGDIVHLSWDHNYVTTDGGSGPERPITKLEKSSSPQK